MLRIAVTGPESSGKTTLVKQLSEHYHAHVVDEFVRSYAAEKKISVFEIQDLEEIAREQARQNAVSDENFDLIICDTEMLVMKIWADDKFGFCPDSILNLYYEQKFDLVFLCFPDVKWEYDPLRSDENRREELFLMYKKELEMQNTPYYIIRGENDKRIEAAISTVERYRAGEI